MSHGETPKKLHVCVVKKPKHERPKDYCRCCKLSLKLHYDDSWKSISTENLFKLIMKRESKVRFYLNSLNKLEFKS